MKVKDDIVYINEFLEYNQSIAKNNTWFTPQQLSLMSEGKYGKPDFLRDIAKILLNMGDLDNASRIIAKALELRPHGPAIIDLSNKIEEMRAK